MNIPKKDVVSFVLTETLRKKPARSQRELSELLNKRFKKSSGYSISSSRARRIAILTPGIRVRIQTRRGPKPKRCPSCGHSLRKTHTRNLKGRRVLLSLICPKCPYRASNKKWIPARYEFWSG
jgi:hypothetical protein